ncbi:TonB-dependent siderophore receptor [Geothrix sp. PMB-07]|uniref:TonB-dependent receptor plug domain-containing protein n=1 Tax=Geothrix sp. PMB-07 TaxID=3068640 RepID=UPI0027426306|nr:TonB-dependent receptor plug domain-containing protein [Geothrix sp. PMB-07]WLT32688.1 TonB-dependent receptor plug domain-containing protein [Geothrix sp. PMB-07]
MPVRLGALGLASLLGSPLVAQETEPLGVLEDLLRTRVVVATKRPQAEESAPSIVSVVTRADIERYGWRDLADILRALPGFDFALDGTGLIGLSERGIWAHEGKALVMVDGLAVSPIHNGNVNYYGFIPSEMVERVEVIRGPGSAVYGQFAGVAVINVITHNAQMGDQGRFALRGSTLGAGNQGGGAFLSVSDHLSDAAYFSLRAGYQADPFSNQPYVDTFFTQQAFPQDKGNARRENTFVAGEVQALGMEVRFLRTAFQIAQVDGAGSGPLDPVIPGLPPGVPGAGQRVVQGFRLQRTFQVRKDLSLEAAAEQLTNDMGVLYAQSRVGSGVFTSGSTRGRFTGDATLKWAPSSKATLLLGGGGIQDWERSVNLQNQGGLRDPSNPAQLTPQITLNTQFAYAQYDQEVSAFGITVGGRYESNSVGHAFAPRLGLTYADGPFNAKLLYGEAFREPSIFQEYSTLFAYTGLRLQPELIRSNELQVGWRFSHHAMMRLNLYRTAVSRVIEGFLTSNSLYSIQNAGSVHAKGLEAQFETQYGAWGAFGNLSITRPDGEVVPFYLASNGKSFLGVSPVKINVGIHFEVGACLVAPSLLYVSSREAQTPASARSGYQPGTVLPTLLQSAPFPARLIANLALTWDHILGPDTKLRFTFKNLGNAAYPILQPYYGGHAPLAANDRSFTADLVWTF